MCACGRARSWRGHAGPSAWRSCATVTIICAEPYCASRAVPTSWWARGFCRPDDPDCAAAAIFFNNAGYLGMCGHGSIGVAVTLAHLGRIAPGRHRLQTLVGTVTVDLAFRALGNDRERPRVSQCNGRARAGSGLRRVSWRRCVGRKLVFSHQGASVRFAPGAR